MCEALFSEWHSYCFGVVWFVKGWKNFRDQLLSVNESKFHIVSTAPTQFIIQIDEHKVNNFYYTMCHWLLLNSNMCTVAGQNMNIKHNRTINHSNDIDFILIQMLTTQWNYIRRAQWTLHKNIALLSIYLYLWTIFSTIFSED